MHLRENSLYRLKLIIFWKIIMILNIYVYILLIINLINELFFCFKKNLLNCKYNQWLLKLKYFKKLIIIINLYK